MEIDNDKLTEEELDYWFSSDNYRLPCDKDFYLGAVDNTFLKRFDKYVNEDNPNGKNTAYYAEKPPYEDSGIFNNAYVAKLKVDTSKKYVSDSNLLRLSLKDVYAKSSAAVVNALKATQKDQATKYSNKLDTEAQTMFVELIGFNPPSSPITAYETVSKDATKIKIVDVPVKEIRENQNSYVIPSSVLSMSEESKVKMVQFGNKWHYIYDDDYSDNGYELKFKWLVENYDSSKYSEEQLKDRQKIIANLERIIKESDGEITLVLDPTPCTDKNSQMHFSELLDNDDALKTLSFCTNDVSTDIDNLDSGFNQAQDEALSKFKGIAYIKKDGEWINLSKALQTVTSGDYSDTSYRGVLTKSINIKNYSRENFNPSDCYFKTGTILDDRKIVQKKIFGREFSNNDLNKWTVTLGDVTLFIPPVNITFYSQNESERIPLLRANGSMQKQKRRSTRHLQLTIYFNEDFGINGYKCRAATPSGDTLIYHMNGLRSLFSQFKFMPFIPIENYYINETLDIWAVTVNNLTCGNVPGYPKLIQATLTLTEFNYEVYIPEAVVGCAEDLDVDNAFSASINWGVARYYYQRALIAGDNIKKSGLKFNSTDYNKQIIKNRTSLIPMDFKNPYLNFYLADTEYLDAVLERKLGALYGAKERKIVIDNDVVDLAKDFSAIYDATQNCSKTIKTVKSLMEAQTKIQQQFENINKKIGRDVIGNLNVKINYLDFAIDVVISLSNAYTVDESKITDLKYDVSNYIGVDPSKIMVNNQFRFSFKLEFYQNGTYENQTVKEYSLQLDNDNSDLQFLAYCKDMSQSNERRPNYEKKDDELKVSSANLTSLDNLYYNLYEIDHGVLISSWNVSLSNHISQVNLSGESGSSPQYLGGDDLQITVKILTLHDDVVQKLSNLPRICATYGRIYHAVMPASAVRIQAEFAQFFGIHEVLIQDVTVDTVQGHPQAREITINMLSNDRTLRNREALDRIEADNAAKIGKALTEKQVQSYFKLEKYLAKTELYPDLELPTLEEMDAKGFHFTRYTFQDDRVYVDPDFYFIYPWILTSQVIRELILKSVENGIGTETEVKDAMGAEANIEIQSRKGFDVVSQNDVADEQMSILQSLKNGINAVKSIISDREEDATEYEPQEIRRGLQKEDRVVETWKICDDIQALFLERNYKQELEYYSQFVNFTGNSDLAQSISNQKATAGEWASVQLSDHTKALEYLTSTGASGQGNDIDSGVAAFLKGSKDALDDLNIDTKNEKFVEILKKITYAAACAATAEKEYSSKDQSNDWQPNFNYLGTISNELQDTSGETLAHSVDEAARKATEFSVFKLKLYSVDDIIRITNEGITKHIAVGETSVNALRLPIDPYYRNADANTVAEYKKKCIESPAFAACAYLRIALYWLVKLHQQHVFPNINNDVLSKLSESGNSTVSNYLKSGKYGDTLGMIAPSAVDYQKRRYIYDLGKMWAGCVLASSDGDKTVRHHMVERDYVGLNSFIEGVSNSKAYIKSSETTALAVRKMILALVGQKVIKDIDASGIPQDSPAYDHFRNEMEKKYIEAAEDPSIYCVHACHDMIVHDARGRMLRAFPTYYMALIDEGREIGQWKLHDNFYSNMAISSMEIVKSRKIPADTAIITMSNFYQQFSTEDEDYRRYTQTSFGDVWDSIFSPTDYGKRQEKKSKRYQKQALIRLRPGARVHLRMGYGSNASILPTVFNGTIAEVSALDTVEIVAQGDGVELMNPIYDDEEAHQIIHKDDLTEGWFTNGGTPRQIINSILTTHGGILSDFVHSYDFLPGSDFLKGLFNRNPYGLYHFGNPRYTDITKSGEITQNIFEAVNKPAWGSDDDISDLYGDNEAPHISFDMFQKTVWDCANICASVSPDFICAVTPFDYRSTLFIGHPRFYYAYKYTLFNDQIVELRKPYQQFHIYNSSTDIISNGIVASRSKIKTAAIGLYQIAGMANYHDQEKVGPLFVDVDIFPEEQKTMIVDTQLWGKGVPYIGAIGLNIFQNQLFNYLADDKGAIVDYNKIAWRMTASALKNSVKDMYQGDLVVLGDPTVKPHDRLMIADQYSGVSGQCTVKEVIMKMSVDDGFITTILPDCINVVDDRFEFAVNSFCGAVSRHVAAASLGLFGLIKGFRYQGNGGTIAMIKDIATKLKNNTTAGKMLSSSEGLIKSMTKYAERLASGGKELLAGSRLLKMVLGIGGGVTAASSIVAAFPAIIASIAAVGATELVGSTVSTFIARAAKNWQVLQIFPLKRYGLTWTAGLTGSKGLVVGSPTYNEQGALESVFSEIAQNSVIDDLANIGSGGTDLITGGEEGRTAGLAKMAKGVLGLIMGLVKNDEIEEIAKKYEVENNIVDENDNPTMPVSSLSNKLKTMVSKTGILPSDFRHLLLEPRVEYNSEEAQEVYNHFAILDTKQAHNDPKLNYNLFVSGDTRLKKYIENGYFKIVHETPGLNKGKGVDTKVFTCNGNQHYVKVVSYNDSNGNLIMDLPMLNKDALAVLDEIIKRAKDNMPASKSSDKLETWDFTKTSFIMLESALRIGDTESPAATGFVFVLEATDEASPALKAAISSIQKDVQDLHKKIPTSNEKIFETSMNGGKTSIAVLMPKLITQEKEEVG